MSVPPPPHRRSLRKLQPARFARRFRACRFEPLEPRHLLAADITTGLAHHWTFDETSGNIAADVAGGTSGTLVNWTATEPKWEPGRIGGALRFDTADNYVTAQQPSMSGSFAVSFWLNVTDRSGPNARVLEMRFGTLAFINNESNRGVGFANNNDWVLDPNPPTFNVWEHYAINFNAATDQGVIYRGGAPVAIGAYVDSASLPTWIFGHSYDLGYHGHSLRGLLDDIRIYDRLLKDDDIALLASMGTPEPVHQEPIHHWTFDETTGFTAHDTAGGADGILLNWNTSEPRWEPGKVDGALRWSTADNAVVTSSVATGAQWSIAFWLSVTARTGINPRILEPWAYINLEGNRGVGFTSRGNIHTFDPKPVTLGTWDHYAITFDTVLDVGTIYRNGVAVNSGFFGDNSPASVWVFGHQSGDLGNHNDSLNGLLDDFRFYDRLLAEDEISSLADVPIAAADSFNVNEDKTLQIAAPGVLDNDSDSLDRPLAALREAGPSHGTLTLNSDGSFGYSPMGNYNGPDSFTYRATNGETTSEVATATITVAPVNDAPSFFVGADRFVTDESGSRQITHWAFDVSPGPPDEASQTLTFTCVADDPSLFTVQPKVVHIVDGLGSYGRLTYTVAKNVSGTATVTIQLTDSGGTDRGGISASPPQTFQINIAKPYRWYNTVNLLDVNNSGGQTPISALDALIIFNVLNAFPGVIPTGATNDNGNFRILPTAPIPVGPALAAPPFFYDTSRDNFISAIDALLVINRLNSGAVAEAESPPRIDPSPDSSSLASLVDLLAADISQHSPRRRTRILP